MKWINAIFILQVLLIFNCKQQPVKEDNLSQKILSDTAKGHVAIGGITLENIEDVLKAGAGTIAVCSAVTQSADPAKACRSLKEKITRFQA